MRILMIHGRAQGGKDPADLKNLWIDTLRKSYSIANLPFPDDVEFDFPFYGDALNDFTEKASLPLPEEIIKKGPGTNREFEEFMKSVLEEMKTQARITNDEISELLDSDIQEKGIENWGWVQAIARAIDRQLTDVSGFTVEIFLKDVFLYVSKPAVTKGINKIVEEYLTDQPTLVIGHSLGSVVSYKVIMENLGRLNLVKHITLGCPLGIKAISSKLGILRNPAGKENWYNGYDERDIVALNPLDGIYFPTETPITNNSDISNHTDNHHGIVGYLNDIEIARQITNCA